MKRNLPLYLIGGIVLMFFLFFVSQKIKKSSDVNVGTSPTDSTQQAVVSNKSALEMQVPTTKMKVNDSQMIRVVLSKAPVAAIDVVLTYDPAVLELSAVKKSSSFPQIIQNTIDNKKGMLIYSASVDPTKDETLAKGEVLSFIVKAKGVGKEAKLDFNTTDTIAAVNGENTLSATKGILFEIVK